MAETYSTPHDPQGYSVVLTNSSVSYQGRRGGKSGSHVPTTRYPVQGRRPDGTYSCGKCEISYRMPEGFKPACPLCAAKEEIESLRQHLMTMSSEADALKNDLRAARARADYAEAMREALDVASPHDLGIIKSIAYRWRADPGQVAIIPLESGKRVVGIKFHSIHAEPERYVLDSVGGVAFAECYAALFRSLGGRATEQFAQALSGMLASP